MNRFSLFIAFCVLISWGASSQVVTDGSDESMFQMRRNTVLAEGILVWPAVYYERAFPVGDQVAFNVGGGVVPAVDVNRLWPAVRLGILAGTNRHMVEVSLLRIFDFTRESDLPEVLPFFGYRYTSRGGLHLKLGMMLYTKNNDFIPPILPTYSIGYSF